MLMLTHEKHKQFKINGINVLIHLNVVFMPCSQTLHGPDPPLPTGTRPLPGCTWTHHTRFLGNNLRSVLRTKKKNTIFNPWVILSLGPGYAMCDDCARRLWNVFPGNRRRPNCSFMEKNRKTGKTTGKKKKNHLRRFLNLNPELKRSLHNWAGSL